MISDFELERKITNVLETNERNQPVLDERSNTVANETRKEGYEMIREVIGRMDPKFSDRERFKQILDSCMKGEKLITTNVKSIGSKCSLCEDQEKGNFIHNHRHRIMNGQKSGESVTDPNEELKLRVWMSKCLHVYYL